MLSLDAVFLIINKINDDVAELEKLKRNKIIENKLYIFPVDTWQQLSEKH